MAATRPPRRLLLALPGAPLLLATYGGDGLHALEFWPQGRHPPAGTRSEPERGDELGRRIADELREYFAGVRRAFGIPIAPRGTPFQRRVWEALRAIPAGEVEDIACFAELTGGTYLRAGNAAAFRTNLQTALADAWASAGPPPPPPSSGCSSR